MTDETSPRTFDFALSSAALAALVIYAFVDFAVCAGHLQAGAAPSTLGFILLGAALLGGGTAIVLRVAIAIGQHIPRPIFRALAAAAIAWYPARWLASAITSGSGISRSGWATSVQLVVLGVLLLAAAGASGLLPMAHGRLRRRSRILIGATIVILGLAAMTVTSFHATTYVRAYRGVLVVSALLIEIGFVLVVGSRAPAANRWRARLVTPLVFAGIVVSGLGLTRIGGSQRAYAAYTIFTHTLIAQKLQTLLLRVSPVFQTTSRVSLDETRLAANNAVPVPATARGNYRGHNVLFVTFDALRADVIAQTHDGHEVAPNLKLLAARGISFRNAIANYSHTSRSILSILAGSWRVGVPSETQVSTDASDVRARTRLPRLLRGAGYESVAIMMSGRWGEVFFDKDRFPEFDRHIPAGDRCEHQVAAFKRYLAERTDSRPFWAWLHLFDTHTPFATSSPDELFRTSPVGGYMAAVHHADRCLGELLAAMKATSEWNRTIVVVSADHGEALGEHGRTLRHSTCFWHDIHIPVVFRLPDREAPVSIDYPIQAADLVPTLAHLLDLRFDEPEVDGDDLSGLLAPLAVLPDRDETPASMAFTQGHAQQYRCASVVSGRWHLIYTDDARAYELYDLDADPREEQNLAAERPDVVDSLQPMLDTFRARATEVVGGEP